MQPVIFMIQIITIDLDGTLFDNEKRISEENKKAIRFAKEKGCKVVIASGRPFNGVKNVLKELDLTSEEDYVICYNGAKILNAKTGKLVFSTFITGKEVKDVYREAVKHHYHFHAFRENEELLTPQYNPYTDVECRINHIEAKLHDIVSLSDNDHFLKAMIVDSDENITKIMPMIPKNLTETMNMVRSSKIFLEFLNKESNKGLALKFLADFLAIDIKNTMAIGDAGNDLAMIKLAGIGVAMENAFPDIKQKADFITSSNENNGVAKAIYTYIK